MSLFGLVSPFQGSGRRDKGKYAERSRLVSNSFVKPNKEMELERCSHLAWPGEKSEVQTMKLTAALASNAIKRSGHECCEIWYPLFLEYIFYFWLSTGNHTYFKGCNVDSFLNRQFLFIKELHGGVSGIWMISESHGGWGSFGDRHNFCKYPTINSWLCFQRTVLGSCLGPLSSSKSPPSPPSSNIDFCQRLWSACVPAANTFTIICAFGS